jgi:hypothetical protein
MPTLKRLCAGLELFSGQRTLDVICGLTGIKLWCLDFRLFFTASSLTFRFIMRITMNEVEQMILEKLRNRFVSRTYSQRNIDIVMDRLSGTKWADISEMYGVRIERAREIFHSGRLFLMATMPKELK